jgi:MoxR-like ATPase
VGAVDRVRAQMQKVLSGKDNVIDLLLVGLFGAGHVLVEDVPGVGKTTLAKALSKALSPSPACSSRPICSRPTSSDRRS